MTAQPHEDWLATTSVEFTSAEVLYGSPCGLAVGLDRLYWCEDTRRVISSQCTLKEIDTFLNNDCNQIYGVEQAELFQNKGTICRARTAAGTLLPSMLKRWEASLSPMKKRTSSYCG